MPHSDPVRKSEYHRAYNAKRYKEDPEYKAQMLKWRLAHPERLRSYALMSKFGITLNEFNAMLDRQDKRCAICRCDNPGRRTWHVDHDHVTGRIQGLLCSSCNQMLGNARDEPERLEAGAIYLRKYQMKCTG